MTSVSILEPQRNPKCFFEAAYQIGNHNLKRTSHSPIVQSQHDYFFVPTTTLRINI
ncbi:hypothetical protein MCN98_09530 [Flavobacteriaceae bacterium LSUCC0859]|nr:hypothetical protein [Flavobacteriaceae bacterium LSUCC0859]